MLEPRSKKLLFISPSLAMPSQHGGCVYPHALLKILAAEGAEIHYAWLGTPLHAKRLIMRSPFVHDYVSRGYLCNGRALGAFFVHHKPLGALLKKSSPASHGERLPNQEERDFITRLVKQLAPAAILVDSTAALPVLDGLPAALRRQSKVSVLTHNLQSRRTELYRRCGQALDFLPMSWEQERELLERADVSLAIQEREAEAFKAMLPGKEVATVTMPQELETLPEPPEGTEPTCLFIGGNSGHNIAGIQWLLSEVWPLILAGAPKARLKIFGTVCHALGRLPAQVEACGPIARTSEAYAQCHVALAPLVMGSGLKIKVVEAMAHARPVVTTEFGAEGFADLESGEVIIVRQAPQAFAEASIALLAKSELRQEAVAKQNAWLKASCSPQQVARQLDVLW